MQHLAGAGVGLLGIGFAIPADLAPLLGLRGQLLPGVVADYQRAQEVEAALGKVPGLVSYTLVRTRDGGTSVTVCKDKSGIDESSKVAREWIKTNASNVQAGAPAITEGSVIAHI